MSEHEGWIVRIECHTEAMANALAEYVRKEWNGNIFVFDGTIQCDKCS